MRSTATKLGIAALAAASCVVAGIAAHHVGRSSAWAASASPAPSKPVTIAGDPARDTAVRTFLQKRFRLASIDQVKLGPLAQSPLAGLFGRQVSLTNDKGESRNGLLFTDRNETKFVIGEYLDLDRDPWGRVSMSAVHLDDRPVLGPSTAPVTVVEFADFECPFCAHAFGIVETLANSTYKGRVRVVYKNFPLNGHQWAMKAAEAAECARLQNPDAFWEFARDFYTNQGSLNPGNLQKHIDGVAERLKLDAPSLKACMAAPAAADRVKQDVSDGDGLHVSSTPTFFIDGIPVVGLPDEKTLDFVVSSELAETSHASR